MELSTLLTEDRAVSPVIGVILMVAITVILAAVIGTFVLGLGQNVQSTPSASFDFDFNSSNTSLGGDGVVNVTHSGGDTLTKGDNANTVSLDGGTATSVWFDNESDDAISAGDTESVGYVNGETVRVIWEAEGTDNSAVLGQQDAPS